MGAVLPMKPPIRNLLFQPKVRLALLLSLLLGLLILNLAATPVQNSGQEHDVARMPESANKRQNALGPYGAQVGRVKWEPSGEDIFVEASVTLVTEEPVRPPEPPAPTVPPPAPEPVAPPLPYVVMGKFKSGEKSTLYLRAGNNTIPVSEGDLLGSGDYKIEGISESEVSIRYLPMNHLHELSLSGLE